MSIQNKVLEPGGTYKVIKEGRVQNILAKMECLVFGHMPIRFDIEEVKDKKYCICCWKEL